MEVGAASRCLRNVEEGEVKSPEGRRDYKYLEGKRETSLSRKRLDRRMEAYERKEVEGVAQDAQEIIEGVGKWNERGMEQESNGQGGMRQENIDRGEVSRYDEIGGSENENNINNGAMRAAKYEKNWRTASLKDAINTFAPDVEPIITQKGKMIFYNEKTGISIVYDINGDYFRIEDTNRPRGRNYLDISGNDMNNEVVDGKIRGRNKEDYQRLTHFKNSDKLERKK